MYNREYLMKVLKDNHKLNSEQDYKDVLEEILSLNFNYTDEEIEDFIDRKLFITYSKLEALEWLLIDTTVISLNHLEEFELDYMNICKGDTIIDVILANWNGILNNCSIINNNIYMCYYY